MAGLFPFMVPAVSDSGYRYLRIYCSDLTGVYFTMNLLQFSPDGGTTKYPDTIGVMTSNTAPSPLVASASSEFSAGYEAWRAFNNNAGDGHNSAAEGTDNGWIKIDLGSGNEITPNWCRHVGQSGSYILIDYVIQGSNTGNFSGEETTFKTVTGNGTLDVTDTW